MIQTNCRLLDAGCGTGDLLFKASTKIRYGLGVDLDPGMIHFANIRKRKLQADKLEFMAENINTLTPLSDYPFDIATSTLCLHEMKESDAVSTLKTLAVLSSQIIIADFSDPESGWSKLSIEFDEMISGHYLQFRAYREKGGLPYLAKQSGLSIRYSKQTAIDGISIWILRNL